MARITYPQQADFFGAPALPGLGYREDLISAPEERELIACIDRSALSPFRFQQWTGKRLTRSFGWSYDFETRNFGLTDPFPAWLESLRVRAADFSGLNPADLVQVLLTRYDPGAGIGWHRDRPVFGHVIGVSLGEAATLRFRRRTGARFRRYSISLAPRSIYHLEGEARNRWEHGIAPMARPRWSITFRTLAPQLSRVKPTLMCA